MARTAMLLVAGFLVGGGVSRADVQAPPTSLTVRLYNTAGLSAAELRLVIHAATVPLDSAGITITWADCSSGLGSGTSVDDCRRPVGPADLVVRILQQPNGGRASSVSPRGVPEYAGMGYSLVSVPTPSFASVHVAVVREVADQAGVDVRVVLGRAVAHELGHLLLNTNGHGDRGLMRARWSRQELSRDESRDWRFSDREVAAMRVAVERRARRSNLLRDPQAPRSVGGEHRRAQAVLGVVGDADRVGLVLRADHANHHLACEGRP